MQMSKVNCEKRLSNSYEMYSIHVHTIVSYALIFQVASGYKISFPGRGHNENDKLLRQ